MEGKKCSEKNGNSKIYNSITTGKTLPTDAENHDIENTSQYNKDLTTACCLETTFFLRN